MNNRPVPKFDRKELRYRFKEAVRLHFDESVEAYDEFEGRHGLFRDLASRMADLVAPAEPRKILDVGCGSGISTLALHRSFPSATSIFGLDISDAMLVRARERCRLHTGLYFLNGDAEHLDTYFRHTFDAVFYTASLFLIPNYRNSLLQAIQLLVPKGVLGITFYEGIFDERRKDLVAQAVPGMPYRYGALEYGDLKAFLDDRREIRTTQVDYFFEISGDFLREFLAIPAQSAGLFPRTNSAAVRREQAMELADRLTDGGRAVFMGWKIVVARKG